MQKEIGDFTKEFLDLSKEKPIKIVSLNNLDGVTSSAILIKTLKRLDKKFSIKIIKEKEQKAFEENFKERDELNFLIGLNPSNKFEEKIKNKIFLINNKINQEYKKINSIKVEKSSFTNAELTYIFSKKISEKNKDLSKIAILSYVQEDLEENSPLDESIATKDTIDLEVKKGLLIYPSTRPLKRALEASISPYIPGVTGNTSGTMEILRKSEISPEKSLIDLNEEEMSRLITSIIIKMSGTKSQKEITGDIYSIKFFSRKEDLREIAVIVNICSRLGYSDIAISYCLENERAKSKALDIYTKYRTELVSGIKTAEKADKINGNGFVILNAKDKIKETIVGRVCSMLSSSPAYEKGTILIGIAYNKDKIKVSARIAGKSGRNIIEVIEKTVTMLKEENPNAEVEYKGNQISASCKFERENETKFLEALKKNLEIEVIRV